MTDRKVIKHGAWLFDYGKKNIYKSDVGTLETQHFSHTDQPNAGKDGSQLTEKDLEDFRKASLIHQIARKKAQSMLCTGCRLADLVDAVEQIIIKLCRQNQDTYFLKGSDKDNSSGIAFPVGVNINNVVAHDSKTIGIHDDRVFSRGDVVKIDIGVHVNGRIIDSAFTHIVTDVAGVHDRENIYNSVLEASRDAMFTGIAMMGVDQRLVEVSESIDEVIRSYEVTLGGNDMIPIVPIEGIGGHNIRQYQIHGGKLILSKPDYEIQGDQVVEEDEIYAIETFATTGNGVMTQNSALDRCTHFMETREEDINKNKGITKKDKKHFRQTEFYDWMRTRQGLPFSSAWIDSVPKVEKAFKQGIPSGQIVAYPPLFDAENSVVAQFEHTIHIKDNTVEIFSLGEDY
jgi:methionyl aminopeptidase